MANLQPLNTKNILPLSRVVVYLLKNPNVAKDEFLINPSLVHKECDLSDTIELYRYTQTKDNYRVNTFLKGSKAQKYLTVSEGLIIKKTIATEAHGDVSFLITFGAGARQINRNSCEDDFGLRVVLNLGLGDQVRSVTTKNLIHNRMTSIQNLPLAGGLKNFDIQTNQAILRHISTKCKVEGLGRTISGGQALQVSIRGSVFEIDDKLKRIYEAYLSQSYKENGYDWIDYIRPVRNKETESRLNLELEKYLRQLRETGQSDLEIFTGLPSHKSGDTDYVFSFSDGSLKQHPDYIDLKTCLDTFQEDFSIANLKSKNIYLYYEDTRRRAGSVRLYDCLSTSLFLDNEEYALDDGHWYRVDTNYHKDLVQWYDNLGIKKKDWPIYEKQKKGNEMEHSERSYAEKCAKQLGYCLLDQDCIRLPNASPIEPCDLFYVQGSEARFVHLKVYKGKSTELSHHFAQSLNSATLFLNDQTFREELNKKIGYVLSEQEILKPTRSKYKIVIGIITKQVNFRLPLFSMMTLRSTFDAFRRLGVEDMVSVELIEGKW